MNKKICIFDVNETLLDLKALDPYFEKRFGNVAIRQAWFQQFIHNAFVSIITKSYVEFSKIGLASLEMISNKFQITLTDDVKNELLDQMTKLPAHSEVAKALEKLKNNEFRLFTLTNSTKEVVTKQLNNAGISDFFEENFSADAVKTLKPGREPYEYVINKLGVNPKNIILIAAHPWDIAGAQSIGFKTAFIARQGIVYNPLLQKPDFIGNNLTEVVEEILSQFS